MRHVSIMTALLLFASMPAWAQQDESWHQGLLRGRDLTPFGFLRLDMRPAHSVSVQPGTSAVEATLGYQNTWALSQNVEDYLSSLPGRRRLGPEEIAAIHALPGEKYLVDMELGLLDLAYHRKLDAHWSAYAGVGLVWYGGGFLDGLIENWHEAFGFDRYGRPAVQRNDVLVLYDLKGVQYTSQGISPRAGVLDPNLGLRYAFAERAAPWNLVVEGAIKLPLGGRRDFLSNGHVDVGAQATLQHVSGRHGAYASASVVYTENSVFGQAGNRKLVPGGILGYEFAWTSRTNLVGQVSASRGTLERNATDLEGLLANKYQYAIGARHRFERSAFTAAITENFKNVNNTPDFGFQFGWVFWL